MRGSGHPGATRPIAPVALAACLVAACGPTAPGPGVIRAPAPDPVVRYTLTVPADPAERLRVEVTAAFASDRTSLRPAAAAVGAYRAAPFGRFMHGLAAFDASGAPLPIEERGGVHVVEGPLSRLTYEVDARAGEQALEDLTVASHRRDGFTFVSGYATFLRVDGASARPHELRVVTAPGWRVATALEATADSTFRAANALELLDEPLMVGEAFASLAVDDAAMPGHVHLYGAEADPGPQLRTIADAYRAAVRGAAAIGLPPLGRPYHLFVELLPPTEGQRLGWAMEHARSTLLTYAQGRFTEPDPGFTYHVVHEVVHAWIPRRLYTASLHPEAQLEATHTPHVWLAEGVAQYLAFVALARSGAESRDDVLLRLARRFARPYLSAAPSTPTSLEDHSRTICGGDHDTWAWQYGAGGLLALQIDQRMRARGDGARGLPDALAELVASAPAAGIPDDELEARLSEATGLDLGPVFARHVHGVEPLDADAILAGAGVSRDGDGFVVHPAPSEESRRFLARAF